MIVSFGLPSEDRRAAGVYQLTGSRKTKRKGKEPFLLSQLKGEGGMTQIIRHHDSLGKFRYISFAISS
jgi:hypothetical protein